MKKNQYIDPLKTPSCALPLELKTWTPEEYKRLFEVLFNSEKWVKTVERRQRMFNVASRPGANVSSIRKGVEQDDRRVADMILHAMQIHECSKEGDGDIIVKDLWAQIPEDDKEKNELKQKCRESLNVVVFLADMLETKLMNIEQYLSGIFPEGNYHFEQFNGVKVALDQLCTVFGKTRDMQGEEAKQVYADYADSIEAYLTKRMKTFLDKTDKIKTKQKERQTHN